MNAMGPEAHRGLIQSVDALHRRGVVHTDVRRANVVWNEEVKRLTLSGRFFQPRRRVLGEVVPNQRARMSRCANKHIKATVRSYLPGLLSK